MEGGGGDIATPYGLPRHERYQLVLRDVMDGSTEVVDAYHLEAKLRQSDPRDWPVTGPVLVAIWESYQRLRARTSEKLGGLLDDE